MLLALLMPPEVFGPEESTPAGLAAEASGLDGCVVAGVVSVFCIRLVGCGVKCDS